MKQVAAMVNGSSPPAKVRDWLSSGYEAVSAQDEAAKEGPPAGLALANGLQGRNAQLVST